MKVIIDGKPNEFISILYVAGHFQCNTIKNHSAHCFNTNPKTFPRDKEIKTNGCIYIFPSK
jgi:hypothetical protein